MKRRDIEQNEKMNILFEGTTRHGENVLVIAIDNVQIIMKDQGDHDDRFYIIKLMMNEEEAIAKGEYFCNR